MEDEKHTTSFTFEIDNYSEKDMIASESFLIGGCEWNVFVFPKGVLIDDRDMYLYLRVRNPESLRLGWKIRTSFSFFLLNQSLKELCRLDGPCQWFCAQYPGWDCVAPLEKLQEKGLFEKNNKLIIKVQVKVFEVVDEGDVTENGILAFQDLYSKVVFQEHPDINGEQLAAYMKDVLGLFRALKKPPCSLSETELNNPIREWIKIIEAEGFELKKKHEGIYLERKKTNVDSTARVQEFEEQMETMIAEVNKETRSITCAARDWLQDVVHSCIVRVGFADVVAKEKTD